MLIKICASNSSNVLNIITNSINTYIRKTKLNNSDYNIIANMPYKDQIEIFKTRSLNKYKLLNPQRYPKSKMADFQREYNTRMKEKNMNELKKLQASENRMELRSAKKIVHDNK